MQLKIKKLSPDAKLPKFAYNDDAGMDIFALEDTLLIAGEKTIVKTGIAMEIPQGYIGLVWDKGSLANKNIHTMAGVVDAGYRGEVLILVFNLGKENIEIKKGQKIAQILIQEFSHPEIIEAEELSETDRGLGRIGSSGMF
ncbi:MAG: dUTP diphosphatase [bacterium]